MDISLKLLVLVLVCWLLVGVFRAVLSFIERFVDISGQIHTNARNIEPEAEEVPTSPVDKKAA